MKLCFLVCVDPEIEKTQMFGIRYMPVWAYTLAAHLRSGLDLELSLHDCRIKDESYIPEADVYFYSALNQDVPFNLQLLMKLKKRFPKALHAIGGPATSSLKMAGRIELLNDFDGVYIGDGETGVRAFLEQLITSSSRPLIYQSKSRFSLSNSLPMDFELLKATFQQYYGGVIEVSRGCPFLCEFCDIRTLPDNNRAHNRPIEIIIEELKQFRQLGIKNVLFACDNFIGDPKWAELLCDEIIKFKDTTGFSISAYTWLTINISNHHRLLEKMRRMGFDMFFIGIESFGTKQLLETAKVQNTKFDLPSAIREIQSYGIVVVAGLIFGFDSDTDETVGEALQGILSSGLISGDPTLLTALSGTPLYRRMQLAGRLRDGKVALGGQKYSTNIRYLRPKSSIISDYVYFVNKFNSVTFQIKRYKKFLITLTETSPRKGGYISPAKILSLIFANPIAFRQMVIRLFKFYRSPIRIIALSYAFYLTTMTRKATFSHFSFWMFNWSNSLVKYNGISEKDFDIESVDKAITKEMILPEGYMDDYFEPIPVAKIKAQRQFTSKTLKELVTDE